MSLDSAGSNSSEVVDNISSEDSTFDLGSIDWPSLQEEFHTKREVRLSHRLIRSDWVDSTSLAAFSEGLLRDDEVPEVAEYQANLETWWGQVGSYPGLRVALAIRIYCDIQRAWEHTDETDAMANAAYAALAAFRATFTDSTNETQLCLILLEHLADLRNGFAMENGHNCSCPVETLDCAEQVARTSQALLVRLTELEGSLASSELPIDSDLLQPAKFLRGTLEAHCAYFGGVAIVARTMKQHISGNLSRSQINDALAELMELEQSKALERDVYRSELQPHIVGLDNLLERVASTHLEELTFPDFEVSYLFPFTITIDGSHLDLDQSDILQAVLLPGGIERLSAHEVFAPLSVERHAHSDVWTHGDEDILKSQETGSADAFRYEVVRLRMPDIYIHGSAGTTVGPLRTDVLLSKLGNHLVRFSGSGCPIGEPEEPSNYHDLNQSIRRGSGFMGTESISFSPSPSDPVPITVRPHEDHSARGDVGRTWKSLGDLARDIVRSVEEWGDAERPGSLFDRKKVRCTFDPAIDAHTVITINRALVNATSGEPGTRYAKGKEILSAIGPMLLVPAERTATGLEEWLRYDTLTDPAAVTNFLGQVAPIHSLATQTARTTCLYTPGLPSWSRLSTNEMIEFVVGSRALLRQWITHLEATIRQATELHKNRSEARSFSAISLRTQRLDLATDAALIRRKRSLLRSEELARSSGHRRIIDALLTGIGADRLEGEVDDLLTELDFLYGQLGDDAEAAEGRREATYQRRLSNVLYVVAVIALGDLIFYVNDSFWPNGAPRQLLIAEFAVYLTGAAALILYGYQQYRRSK